MTHECEKELMEIGPSDGSAQDGEEWTCSCGAVFEHHCDEAEGCCWEQTVFVEEGQSLWKTILWKC